MLKALLALCAIALAAQVSPDPAPLPVPSSAPTRMPAAGQSYDELELPFATVPPANVDAAFAQAAAHHYDVSSARANAASDDPKRQADDTSLLSSGIARHITYAGKRFRIDELNTSMSTLQQCDTGFDYALDLARHTFTAAKLNPVALAYASGLRITLTPSNDRPASGAAIFTGTADSDGSYRLAITYLGSAFSGTPAAKAAVDMYHYSYAVPIA